MRGINRYVNPLSAIFPSLLLCSDHGLTSPKHPYSQNSIDALQTARDVLISGQESLNEREDQADQLVGGYSLI